MSEKNKILNLLLAGVLLAAVPGACVRLEGGVPESDIPVGFSSYAAGAHSSQELSSRADGSFIPAGVTVLPDDSSFGVFAFLQNGVIGSTTARWTDGGWHPAFMFNQQVDFDGTDYSYGPTRYWPANEENTISFWAYYPYSIYSAGNSGTLKLYETSAKTSAYTASSTGAPYATYTVSMNPAQQTDLMFDAFTNADRTYWNCLTPGTVDLNFRHALCLVDFVIAEGNNASINTFSITNLYWSGECPNPMATPIVWQNWSGADTYSIADLTVTNGVVCSLVLMPQTLSASANLTINYDISYPSSDPSYPDPLVYSGNSGSALLTSAGISAWQAGKHYVYRISAGFERIEFEEVVELSDDWTIGNNNIAVPDV